MLYQNQCAIEFLIGEHQVFVDAKIVEDRSALDDLHALKDLVDGAIVELTYRNVLEDPKSAQLLQINNLLKANYAALNEGRRLSRAHFGKPSGDLVEFAVRFKPASGWDNISDVEWDRMVHKALEGLKSSNP